MDSREKYLLRNMEAADAFRARFPDAVEKFHDTYLNWFLETFEPYRWRRIRLKPGSEEFVIGLLCLLHLEGSIQFSIRFPDSVDIELQREGSMTKP